MTTEEQKYKRLKIVKEILIMILALASFPFLYYWAEYDYKKAELKERPHLSEEMIIMSCNNCRKDHTPNSPTDYCATNQFGIKVYCATKDRVDALVLDSNRSKEEK